MKNPRFTGLLLLLAGVLVLMGNTLEVLPPEAFWAGLLTYPIGGYLFFMGSRDAIERFEARTARRLKPRPANPAGEGHAELEARRAPSPTGGRRPGESHDQPVEEESRIVESLRRPGAEVADPDDEKTASPEPLALHDLEPDAGVEADSDGSFPVEVQERQSLADQLEKLAKLQQQGIISAEEYAVAKAKLLG